MPRAAQCAGLLLCLPVWLAAADARDLVRHAVQQNERNAQRTRDYTYLQRQEVRDLDGSGKVKKRSVETWDITWIEGSPYRRLVARNDRPLSPAEQKAEEDKLRSSNDQRRQESSAERARRLAEWQRRQDRQREPLKELPDAFNFTLRGEEQLDGRPVYCIDAMPRPGFKPKSQLANFFPKVKLRLWIDQQDGQGVKVEMDTLDTISFGGFLVRLSKGTRLTIEQTRVNDEVWLPKHVTLFAAARVLLLKSINRDMDFSFSDYKKFEVDSRVVAQ